MSAEQNLVRCRAEVISSCQKNDIKYGDPQADPREDGTYDPETKTVVCDMCYYAILSYQVSNRVGSGRALNEELDDTIALMKKDKVHDSG